VALSSTQSTRSLCSRCRLEIYSGIKLVSRIGRCCMRLVTPILLVLLTAGLLITNFLTWGIILNDLGWELKEDGWTGSLHADTLMPGLGEWGVPNYGIWLAVGLATVAIGFRLLGKSRISIWIAILLCAYASYQSGIYVWYYSTGQAIELTYPRSQTSYVDIGGMLALGLSLAAFLVSFCSIWSLGRPSQSTLLSSPAKPLV
jgi:hypothetical protein